MKHVFFVSSNLTFFIANKIIQLDGLKKEECCLLLVRNYQLPVSYRDAFPQQITTDYNVDKHTGRVFAGMNVRRTKANILDFDSKVDPFLQGEPFIWYSPVCSNDICSLMVSKPNCTGYYIIEDGLASYRQFNPQTFNGWRYIVYKCVLKPLFPRIFCVKNHFITTNHPKFRGCIATSDKCFPLHQKALRVIGNPFDERKTTDNLPQVVISIDPWYQLLDIDTTERVYRQLSEKICTREQKTIACKLHPRFDAPQNTAIKEQYIHLLKRCFKDCIILPRDSILEQILVAPSQEFYCGMSSVALYVSQRGVQCYSFIPMVKNTPAWEQLPAIMQSIVTPIGEPVIAE
ncbi:MAG: hypothetical protein II928_04390 [Paludibacteraceae bacterium]|nr:hypothetical protein [Paludibacteraceae bacterium]